MLTRQGKAREMSERPWSWRRHPGQPLPVLAHRGGTGPWNENSLEAFSGALSAGADGVELDVRRSADGELVVHHDAEIPGAGLIHELRRRQIPEWVPTLGARPGGVRGGRRQRRDQERSRRPRVRPRQPGVGRRRRRPGRGRVGAGGPARPAHVMVSSFWPDTLAAVSRADGAVAPRAPRAPGARRRVGARHAPSASGAWRSIPITRRWTPSSSGGPTPSIWPW